jgi:hypothetical protein
VAADAYRVGAELAEMVQHRDTFCTFGEGAVYLYPHPRRSGDLPRRVSPDEVLRMQARACQYNNEHPEGCTNVKGLLDDTEERDKVRQGFLDALSHARASKMGGYR